MKLLKGCGHSTDDANIPGVREIVGYYGWMYIREYKDWRNLRIRNDWPCGTRKFGQVIVICNRCYRRYGFGW